LSILAALLGMPHLLMGFFKPNLSMSLEISHLNSPIILTKTSCVFGDLFLLTRIWLRCSHIWARVLARRYLTVKELSLFCSSSPKTILRKKVFTILVRRPTFSHIAFEKGQS